VGSFGEYCQLFDLSSFLFLTAEHPPPPPQNVTSCVMFWSRVFFFQILRTLLFFTIGRGLDWIRLRGLIVSYRPRSPHTHAIAPFFSLSFLRRLPPLISQGDYHSGCIRTAPSLSWLLPSRGRPPRVSLRFGAVVSPDLCFWLPRRSSADFLWPE